MIRGDDKDTPSRMKPVYDREPCGSVQAAPRNTGQEDLDGDGARKVGGIEGAEDEREEGWVQVDMPFEPAVGGNTYPVLSLIHI